MLTVAILEAQNKKLREEIEELRETIRQLREGTQAAKPLPAGLPYLTMHEEGVFRALHSRMGQVMSREAIYRQVYDDRVHVIEHTIDVFICRLRKKIGPAGLAIDNVRGRGWCMRALADERIAA